jgi:hypothetical protein
MPRIRTIQPTFAKSPSMGRVSREARLLFILLWLEADDAGRLRADPFELAGRLYPHDDDAVELILVWLDQLEGEGCIERYIVKGEALLRIVRWRQYQKVDHPTPSRLPLSPAEWAAREAREASRISREIRAAGDKPLDGQENSSWAEKTREDFFEGAEPAADLTPESEGAVLHDLARVQRNAEAADSFTAALRSIELRGRRLGLWSTLHTENAPKEGARKDGAAPTGSAAVPSMDELFPKEARKAQP